MNGRALVAWNIRKLRVERELSQEKLAADAGIDPGWRQRKRQWVGNDPGSAEGALFPADGFTLDQKFGSKTRRARPLDLIDSGDCLLEVPELARHADEACLVLEQLPEARRK
jgi:transcriptional regulator with XRE-family HTH domain